VEVHCCSHRACVSDCVICCKFQSGDRMLLYDHTYLVLLPTTREKLSFRPKLMPQADKRVSLYFLFLIRMRCVFSNM
jgi:hypothetical protein